jgi:hypothetical protein
VRGALSLKRLVESEAHESLVENQVADELRSRVLQQDEVVGLDENAFARIGQRFFQVDANGDLLIGGMISLGPWSPSTFDRQTVLADTAGLKGPIKGIDPAKRAGLDFPIQRVWAAAPRPP